MLYLCNNCVWAILLNSMNRQKGNIMDSILELLPIFHVYIKNSMLSLLMSSPQLSDDCTRDIYILGFLNCNVCSELDKCKMKHKYLLICLKYSFLIRRLVVLDSEADVYSAKWRFRPWNGLTIIACDIWLLLEYVVQIPCWLDKKLREKYSF